MAVLLVPNAVVGVPADFAVVNDADLLTVVCAVDEPDVTVAPDGSLPEDVAEFATPLATPAALFTSACVSV